MPTESTPTENGQFWIEYDGNLQPVDPQITASTIEPQEGTTLENLIKLAVDITTHTRMNHPKWLHILRFTKKKRTRKKYAKRILQAYIEEVRQ